jgi:hypothetical protein
VEAEAGEAEFDGFEEESHGRGGEERTSG